jgi:hypothetical protein
MPGLPATFLPRLAAWLMAAQLVGSPFGPLQRIDAEGGPTVFLRRDVAVPLVAIRLSLPVDDGNLPGATRVLVELGRESMSDGAALFGGRVSAERLPGFAVFSVVGPARSFDAMVALLRRAVGEPSFDADALARARAGAARQVGAMLEQPETRTRALLRERLFLDSAAIEPGIPAVDSLTPDRLRHVWSTQFQPQRMRAIVVGDLPTPAIRAAFSHWRHRMVMGGSGPGIGVGPRPQPQVLFPWGGIGYRVTPNAVAAVTTELIRQQAATSTLRDGTAELWWQRDGGGLVVLGAARENTALHDTTGGARLLAYLRQRVTAALDAATPATVADAAHTVRVQLLLAARTAAGAAEIVGRFTDASGQETTAQDLLTRLTQVREADVKALLRRLATDNPAFVEVGP